MLDEIKLILNVTGLDIVPINMYIVTVLILLYNEILDNFMACVSPPLCASVQPGIDLKMVDSFFAADELKK